MDPLGLLPYALAAGGGRLDGRDVSQLVSAGVTLLQRSAPLVRTLSGRHSAVAPASWSDWLIALGASDGRGLLTLPTTARMSLDTAQVTCVAHQVGAVFHHGPAWPQTLPLTSIAWVDLEHAPGRAVVVTPDRTQDVDLGTHFGLDLVGDTGTPGRNEPCLALGNEPWRSHREVIAAARGAMERLGYTPVHRTLNWLDFADWDGLIAGTLAPLLAGGMVRGHPALSATEVLRVLEADDATVLVLSAPQLTQLTAAWREAPPAHDPLVRVLVSGTADAAVLAEWATCSAAPIVTIAA